MSLLSAHRPLWLVDFNCFRPDEELLVTKDDINELAKSQTVRSVTFSLVHGITLYQA